MRFVSPADSILFGTVTATPSTDYLASWLTDGRPGYPLRTDGDLSASVAFSSRLVDTVAVCHHNIREAATITLGGGVSSTIPTQPWLANGMPANWYRRLAAPVTATTITIAVSSNGGPTIIGELYAGLSQTLPQLHLGRRLSPDKAFPWEGEFSSLAPYDNGLSPALRVTGTMILTEEQMNTLDAWFLSQYNGSRPTLILPDYPANVAWLAQFNYESADLAPGAEFVDGSPAEGEPPALFQATLEIVVLPPLRW